MVPRARGRPGRPTQSTRRARERRRRERCCARALLQVSSRKRDDRNIARRPQDFHPVFQTDVDKRRLPRREAGIASCRWTRCAVSAGSSTLWSGCSPLETRRRSSGSGRRPISTAWRGRGWRSRGAPTRRTLLPHPAPPSSGPSARALDPCSPCWIARSEEHTSELQSQSNLVCRLLLEKKKKKKNKKTTQEKKRSDNR